MYARDGAVVTLLPIKFTSKWNGLGSKPKRKPKVHFMLEGAASPNTKRGKIHVNRIRVE